LQDQRLGGLLMWLPTHMFLLLVLGITFFKWFAVANREAQRDKVVTDRHAGDGLRNGLQELGV
jgi:cytochrome c oxidase assembly factor CtaG